MEVPWLSFSVMIQSYKLGASLLHFSGFFTTCCGFCPGCVVTGRSLLIRQFARDPCGLCELPYAKALAKAGGGQGGDQARAGAGRGAGDQVGGKLACGWAGLKAVAALACQPEERGIGGVGADHQHAVRREGAQAGPV